MGLGTWASFQGTNDKAMVMGDTVVFEDEVNPAMSAALDAGLSVTALHNHFFFDHPKVYFMHIAGEGSVEQLAAAVRKVYDSIKQIRAAHPQPTVTFAAAALPEKSSISAEPLNAIFGMKGEVSNGMVKFVIGRPAKMHGVSIDSTMGVNTWLAFAGSDDNAVVDGDFAVTEDELQPVLKSLRANGINIVAIHSHMTYEEPRILFFHYWGRGAAKDLAQAVKGGLLVGGLIKVSSPAELKARLTAKKAGIAFALLSCVNMLETYGQTEGPLKLTQTIPLPDVKGRLDHLAVDLSGQRLFLCALGNNTLEVIDLAKGTRVHSISGLGAPQGVAYVAAANRLWVANDRNGICNFYDGKSFALGGSVNFEDDADNVRYDSLAQRIYVGFGDGGLGILDARSGEKIGAIKLSGHPEAFVLEKKGTRIFVNVPTAGHVAVIDRDKREVAARWKTGRRVGELSHRCR